MITFYAIGGANYTHNVALANTWGAAGITSSTAFLPNTQNLS
jgi:hypothetical protein